MKRLKVVTLTETGKYKIAKNLHPETMKEAEILIKYNREGWVKGNVFVRYM